MLNDVVLENISKSFGERQVLDRVNLRFPAGKVSCISGPSGSGKTTLLRLIAGLAEPDGGTVTGVPERIAFVFQEDRLSEDFSAVSNIRLVTGQEKSKEEILKMLTELGLSEDPKKPVRAYSGGMKRRVALARALMYEADLILMDEPFKGLDEALKKTVMDTVKRYTAGKTVIMVTHDPDEAAYMGGEILPLEGSSGSEQLCGGEK